MNTVYMGSTSAPLATLTPDAISEISGYFSSALIGDTLNIDTEEITFFVSYDALLESGGAQLITSDGYALRVPRFDVAAILRHGTPLWWYADSALKGKFYVDSAARTGTNRYKISAVSAVGLLGRTQHDGGMYDGQTATDVLADIIGGNFPYTVDEAVQAQRLYGWLPAATGRENLHKLMLALGINIVKDANGDPIFSFVSAGSPAAVPDSRIFLGGSVTIGDTVSRIEVTEHTFVALDSGETVTVFDNTDGSGYAEHRRVVFKDAPLFGLAATGNLTVETSNCNSAVVSGIGILTGKKYAHVTATVGRDNASATGSRVLRVSDDTLVSPLNSGNVVDRLYAYATQTETISADLKVAGELPNQLLSFTDAFGDAKTAWLKTMQFSATSFIRAKATLIGGYVPGNFGNVYSHVQLVTEDIVNQRLGYSGRVRIVLIQGGTGGQGGSPGAYGLGGSDQWGGTMIHVSTTADEAYTHASPSSSYVQRPAEGGAAGAAGAAGKVFVRDIDVTAETLWTIHVGVGGTGGAAATRHQDAGQMGTEGTHTTALIGGAAYSSEDGEVTPSGVKELLSGETYAKPGATGYRGGNGGLGTGTNAWGISGDGSAGEDVAGFSGGAGGAGLEKYRYVGGNATAGGAGGGGAAYGAAGTYGGDASYWEIRRGSGATADWSDNYAGGDGGAGASALPLPDADYGGGGGGGNGGGGGGNSGGVRIPNPARSGVVENAYPGSGAGGSTGGVVVGGSGSRGGNGGAGLAIIYWG